MKKILVALLLFISTTVLAQPTFEWAAKVDNAFYDEELIDQVVDNNGMVYSVGLFTGTVDFDPTAGVYNLTSYAAGGSSWPDIYITKQNGTGSIIWAVKLGAGNNMTVGDIAIDTNGFVLLTGSFDGTVDFNPGPGTYNLTTTSNQESAFVLKLDENSNFIWARAPNWKTRGVGVTVDVNGDVYAALNVVSASAGDYINFPLIGSFNSISQDFFIWKINSSGNTSWVKKGNGSDLLRHCIVTNALNEVFVILGTSDGLTITDFGGPNYGPTGTKDAYVFKIDSNGSHIWNKVFLGSSSNWFNLRSIALRGNNSIIIGGDFFSTVNFDPPFATHSHTSSGSADGFIVELDYGSNVLYSYSFGGTNADIVNSVSSNYEGEYYLGGSFAGTSDMDGSVGVSNLVSLGNYDAYVLKLNSTGNYSWSFSYGSVDVEEVIVLNNLQDSLYCAGEFENAIDFDPGASSYSISAFGVDPFTVKFSECITTTPVPDLSTLPDLSDDCIVYQPASPTASNCSGSFNGTPDISFPITNQGMTIVTWTYDDGNGNTSTQTQNVVIDDVTAPIADNVSLPDVTAECSVASLTAPTATDNCAGSITGTHNVSLPITVQGTTVVTWTYDDGNGNISTQTQNVIIADVTAPVADIGMLSDINSECEVTPMAPTATDNCAGSITASPDVTFPITATGTTIVTWTYDDGNGNTSTQTQNVVIDDVTAPIADNGSLPDVTAECSVASLTAPTATDNCVGFVSGTHNATLPITTQGTTVVTWTYDDGNGNTSTQTQNVVIDDVTAPTADNGSLPDVTGECSVASITAPTATDNCVGSVTGTHNATLPIATQGATVVTWTYDDGNGNISTQTQNVVIDDVTAPTADNGSLPDVTGECSVASITAPTATDNCVGSVTGTHNATLPITTQGTTVVTWTYDDGNGNTSTQTQNVIIADVTAPVADNGALTDINSECEVTPNAPTATDNCAGSVTATPDVTFPITATGTTTITWTYDDGNGNTSTQTQDVIITPIDVNTTTTANTNDYTISSDASGYTYQWIENCGTTNDVISGATSQSYTPTANGTYAVVIDNGTCSDTSDCVIIDDLGIDADVQSFVKVYPNPTSGVVYIESSIELDSIELIDALGKTIKVYSANQKALKIDATTGVYFLRIRMEGVENIFRVVKQ